MNFDELNKKRNEVQLKLNEAVNLNSFESLSAHLVISKGIEEDLLNKDCKFEFSTEGGRPHAMMYGSSFSLAVAIHSFLEADGDFYKNLRLVIAFQELIELGAISTDGKVLHPESKEQAEVMKEMYKNGWGIKQP